jgi:hypothetical protein
MQAATAIDVSEAKVSLYIAVVELFTQYFTGKEFAMSFVDIGPRSDTR